MKFYICSKDKEKVIFEEVDGEPIKIENINFFIHKSGAEFTISEIRTGLKISSADTKSEAIISANQYIKSVGVKGIEELIKDCINRGAKSPIYLESENKLMEMLL